MEKGIIYIDNGGMIRINRDFMTIVYYPDNNLLADFKEYVESKSDLIAFEDGKEKFTYGQVFNRALIIEKYIIERNINTNLVAVIYCIKNIDIIAMILACSMQNMKYTILDCHMSYEKIIPLIRYYKIGHMFTDVVIQDQSFFHKLVVNHMESVVNINDSTVMETFETYKVAYQNKECSLGGYRYYNLCVSQDELDGYVLKIVEAIWDVKKTIGVLMANPIYLIAIKKASEKVGADIIIIEDINEKQLIEQCKKEKIHTLMYDDDMLNKADTLFWQVDTLEQSIFFSEGRTFETTKEQNFKVLWDVIANEDSKNTNDYGWNNSYNGEKFSMEEMEEYINNFYIKLKPYLGDGKRVFDIGCGHGLVLFKIAPEVSEYYAVDLSSRIIELNKKKVKKEGINHVTLAQASACDIDKLGCKNMDIVLSSSVVQYFPNTVYLEHVLNSAVDMLKEKGIVYIDDLLDLETKYDLIEDTLDYKRKHPNAETKMKWNNDLFIHKDFFEYYQAKYPEVVRIDVSSKLGKIPNELTKYRYDVLITIDKTKKTIHKSKKNRKILCFK